MNLLVEVFSQASHHDYTNIPLSLSLSLSLSEDLSSDAVLGRAMLSLIPFKLRAFFIHFGAFPAVQANT